MLVESLSPSFALFLVTALMMEQPVLLVAAPGSDELLMHAGEWVWENERWGGGQWYCGWIVQYCSKVVLRPTISKRINESENFFERQSILVI